MLKYLKRYSEQFSSNLFSANKLRFLILFVTSQCNCRCSTCFYWQRLNTGDNLSLEEIKKTSLSIGSLHTLLLSGGEPFLRKELLEICRIFIEQNKISILAVPTNGTLTGQILEFSEEVLRTYPKITLSIAVSLDGFKETHDSIRGMPGAFDKAVATLRGLAQIKQRYANLESGINTVITRNTLPELKSFMDMVYNDLPIDFQDFELLRGQYKDKNLELPSLDEIKLIHRAILKNRERYLVKAKSGKIESVAVISLLKFVNSIKERILSGKKTAFACSAGKNIGVIDANGEVRLCELKPPIGNLRDNNYDLPALLNSPFALAMKKDIRKNKCGCTHVCFIKLTVSHHLKTLWYLFSNYLTYSIKHE